MHAMWERIEPLIPAFLSEDQSDDTVEEVVPCLEQIFYDWFCHRLQQHRADAEDLPARTVERIVINRRGFDFRGPGSFRAWCHRIARNVLNDWTESEKKWGGSHCVGRRMAGPRRHHVHCRSSRARGRRAVRGNLRA